MEWFTIIVLIFLSKKENKIYSTITCKLKTHMQKKNLYFTRMHRYSETHLKCIGVGTHGGGKDVGIWNKGKNKWERGLAHPIGNAIASSEMRGGFNSMLCTRSLHISSNQFFKGKRRGEGIGIDCLMGMSFPFGVIKMSWNSIELMTIQHCECIAIELYSLKWSKWSIYLMWILPLYKKIYLGADHSGFLRMQPAPLTFSHHSPVSCLLALETGFSTAAQRPLGPGPKLEVVQNGINSSALGWGFWPHLPR